MTSLDQFEVFMRNYQDMVFSTAMRLLGNATEAEDIAQEVFLRAFNHFPEFPNVQHLGGWLKKITTNLCLNHLTRYRARWHFFSELSDADGEGDDFSARLPAPEAGPSAGVETERWAMLETALQKLPDTQRVPLVLHHFEEMSYDEIAEHLGVSLSKVKIDIFRGREALKRKLQSGWGRELCGAFGLEAIDKDCGPGPSIRPMLAL